MTLYDLTKYVPVIVMLAFILVITSDYCTPEPIISNIMLRNDTPISTFCYIKQFSPEPPEMTELDKIADNLSTILYEMKPITLSGTVNRF